MIKLREKNRLVWRNIVRDINLLEKEASEELDLFKEVLSDKTYSRISGKREVRFMELREQARQGYLETLENIRRSYY